MERRSLKDRLVAYFKKRHSEWVASGDLQRIVAKFTSYTPRTTVRRLEELAASGELEVKYVKGHSWYRIASERQITAIQRTREDYIALGKALVIQFDKV